MYIFIVNPVSGNGRGLKVFQKLVKSTLYQQLETKYYYTEYPGHAEKLANEITAGNARDIKCIVIVGGDGTVHEVLNGLRDVKIPISFIPGGSGNDFGRGTKIMGSPIEILKRIVNDESPLIYWKGHFIKDKEERYFINSIGFGFDAEIAKKANLSKYKNLLNKLRLGTLTYVIALIQVLIYFKPFVAEVELDGEKKLLTDCWMVTIANHQYYGGGMKIIPTAKIQPNIIPVLIIHGISKWKVLGLFITVFTGKHIDFKEVDLYHVEELSIHISNPIYYQVDGQTAFTNSCLIAKDKQTIQIMGSNFS